MTFVEKSQWAYAFAAFTTAVVYFVWLANLLATTPAADIEYHTALLWTIGASMVIHSLGTGMVNGSHSRHETRGDLRDKEIARRADSLSFYIFSGLAAIPLLLALLDFDVFWVANSLFAAFAFTAVAGVVIKSILYRKGF